jgi:hypothetical protein
MKKIKKISEILGIDLYNDGKREYIVTDAPETFTFDPADRPKVLAWLDKSVKLDPDGHPSDSSFTTIPKFFKPYEPED